MDLALWAATLAAAAFTGSAGVPLPPGELRGQVTGASGRPVTSFTVNGVGFTDPQGRFKVLTPPEGEFRVVVRADGLAPSIFRVQGASGKLLDIPEITLTPGEHLLGEVLDADTGMPIPHARATLVDPARIERLQHIRPERVAPVGVSGAGGWYELRRAPRGLLMLVVTHPDYLTELVPVNTREALPTVHLHRGGAIAGSVRDARGAPVSAVRVLALSEEARDGGETSADASGVFELRKLRPGRYRVVARAFGRVTDAGEVTVADGAVAGVSVALTFRQVEIPTAAISAPARALASRAVR